MIELEPKPQPETDDDQSATPEEIGAIAYPDGITAEWIISKTKHLNKASAEFLNKDLLNVEDNYKIVELKQVAGTLPHGTNIPISTSVVDTMNSRLVQGLVWRETFVDAIATDPDLKLEGDADKQTVVTDFTNETIGTTENLADKCDQLFKTMLIENLTFAEVLWSIKVKEELRVQRGFDPMADPALPGPIIGMEPYTYEVGRPDFKPLSWRMCIWDPRVKTKVSDSSYFRKREMVSINGLMALQEEGVIQDVDAVVQKSNKAMTPENPTDPDAKQAQAVEGKQLPAIGWDDGVWELDCWWAKLAWKDSAGKWMQGNYEFWIVGGDTVVKFRENVLIPQRIPIITIKASKKTGNTGLMGQGPVDIIKDLQKALNNNTANLEQLIKNASYSPTFYEPSSGLDGRRVSLQSNTLIPVLNVKGIQRFEPAVEAIAIIEKYIQFIIGQMREATAANDQAQGIEQEGAGGGTATEAQILAQGSNNRFAYLTEMLNAAFFAELANEYFMFWKQFGKPEQMIVKDGSNDGKGYQVEPEDLQGCYIFKPVPTQSQAAKLQHFTQLKSLLADALQLEATNPAALIDERGVQKKVNAYDFVTNQMLPLVNVQPRGLFVDAPAPMLPAGMPMPGAGPAPTPSGPPVGAAPEPALEPETVAEGMQ